MSVDLLSHHLCVLVMVLGSASSQTTKWPPVMEKCMELHCVGGYESCKMAEGGLCYPVPRRDPSSDIRYACFCDYAHLREDTSKGTPNCDLDINECEDAATHLCNDTTATCVNVRGSFECKCPRGMYFHHERRMCSDLDECKENTAGCAERCVNRNPGHSCVSWCLPGFTWHNTTATCDDINECLTQNHTCVDDSSCVNLVGSFLCSCGPGYSLNHGDWASCDDVDECSYLCPPTTGNCTNLPGSYSCHCKPGFNKSDTKQCEDRDECEADACAGANCYNTEGSFICQCASDGYDFTPEVGCTDIDECSLATGPCGSEEVCRNTDGSYTCTNTDECALKICSSSGAECTDVFGSFLCECVSDGYEFSHEEQDCVDVDECEEKGDAVCRNGECVNSVGSFTCHCPRPGHRLMSDGGCSDVNECVTDENRCEGECINTNGSYICSCNFSQGYKLDESNLMMCVDVDECEEGWCDGDPSRATCNNTIGGFSCSCEAGYVISNASGHWCEDVDECGEDGRCGHGGSCRNSPGSFWCECGAGWEGAACDLDTDECGDSARCEQGTCENVDGSFTCVCSEGYKLQAVTGVCRDRDECDDSEVCGHAGRCVNTLGSYRCQCLTSHFKWQDNTQGGKCPRLSNATCQTCPVCPVCPSQPEATETRTPPEGHYSTTASQSQTNHTCPPCPFCPSGATTCSPCQTCVTCLACPGCTAGPPYIIPHLLPTPSTSSHLHPASVLLYVGSHVIVGLY